MAAKTTGLAVVLGVLLSTRERVLGDTGYHRGRPRVLAVDVQSAGTVTLSDVGAVSLVRRLLLSNITNVAKPTLAGRSPWPMGARHAGWSSPFVRLAVSETALSELSPPWFEHYWSIFFIPILLSASTSCSPNTYASVLSLCPCLLSPVPLMPTHSTHPRLPSPRMTWTPSNPNSTTLFSHHKII